MPALYCTPTDIRDNVSGGDGTGSGTCYVLGDDKLNEAIGRATAKVSAYAGATFEVDAETPVVVVPPLLVMLTVQLGTYYATLTYLKGKPLNPASPVALEYADAMRTLADISSGKIQVSPPDPGEPPAPTGSSRPVNLTPRVFSGEDSGTVRTIWGGVQAAGAAGSVFGDPWAWR